MVSEKAYEKLISWGLLSEEIEALQYFTSQFRYDLVAKKLERLTENPVNIYKSGDREYASLSSFFDTGGRFDGQCSDIAKQWIEQIHASNLITELNKNLELKGEKRIVHMRYKGLSETHFNKEGENHCWNGLALIDKEGEVVDQIYIDASLQSIHAKEESLYKEETSITNEDSFDTNQQYNIPIGRFDTDSGRLRLSMPEHAVLGISSCKKNIYALGFLKCMDKNIINSGINIIKPAILRRSEDGRDDCYIEYRDKRGRVYGTTQDKDIKEMLKIVRRFKVINKEGLPPEEYVVWNRPE